MQYSHFSVVSGFPYKTVHPLRNFLAVLSPTPANLYNVETKEKFCAQHLFLGWRQGMGLCSELGNTPEMQKCPKSFAHDRSLWLRFFFFFFLATNWEGMSYKRKYRSNTTSRDYEPSWHLGTYESMFSLPQGIKSRCVSPFLRRNHNLIKPNFHLRRWRKAVIKLGTRDEYKKIPRFLEHLRWCPKMGATTNFVKSQCRPPAACYSLDIQNYPTEEQGNHWDKTKKDITILNDVTSLFVLFVLVSSRVIL